MYAVENLMIGALHQGTDLKSNQWIDAAHTAQLAEISVHARAAPQVM
jgi:hypothetical protein